MATYVPAKINTQYIFYISLRSQADSTIAQSNPTLAAADFNVSTDGGALGALGTTPTVTPAASKMVKVTLSTSEMNGANITLVCSDNAGAEWMDLVVNIQTAARQVDDLAFPATSGRSMATDASGNSAADAKLWLGGTIPAVTVTGVPLVDAKYLLGTVFPTPTVAGVPNVNVKTINDVATTPITTIKAVQGLAVDGVITTLTNLPSIPANWLTAAGINAAALNGKGDWNTTTPPTSAAIATAVWTDTTAGDFTTALSVGKSVMNGVSLGTGLTIAAVSGAVSITGDLSATMKTSVTTAATAATPTIAATQAFNNTGTWTGSLTGSVGSVTGFNAALVDAATSSRMATFTLPANFSAFDLTAAGKVTVGKMNATTVNGDGSAGNPWGP